MAPDERHVVEDPEPEADQRDEVQVQAQPVADEREDHGDDRGFTLSSGSGGWVAVFGFYGLNQRTPALIPGQVQLLSGLLTGREDTVQTVILADDREGTYIAKPTPRPSATPKP